MLIRILEVAMIVFMVLSTILLVLNYKKIQEALSLKDKFDNYQRYIDHLKGEIFQDINEIKQSGSIANHEVNMWDTYQKELKARVHKLEQQVASNYTLMDKRVSASVQMIQDNIGTRKKNG